MGAWSAKIIKMTSKMTPPTHKFDQTPDQPPQRTLCYPSSLWGMIDVMGNRSEGFPRTGYFVPACIGSGMGVGGPRDDDTQG